MNDQTATIIPLDPAARNVDPSDAAFAFENALIAPDPMHEKLVDAQTPGYQAEFDPAEAEAAGAFPEDALSEADALASMHDYPHFAIVSAPLTS